MTDLCPWCGKEAVIVPIGSDVPIPFVPDGLARWHVGCAASLLACVRDSPGALAALRVVASVRDAERVGWTDEKRRR
jgi:hypothetical protein